MGDSAKFNQSGAVVMQIELVLAKIAAALPAKELVTLRPTCKIWNSKFVPQLKKKHRSIDLGCQETNKLREFVEVMRSSKEIPFGRYALGPLALEEEGDALTPPHIERGRQNLADFLAVCGKSITGLQIGEKAEIEQGIGAVRRLMFQLGGQLTELCWKGLGVKLPSGLPAGVEEETDAELMAAASFPRLKSFSFYQMPGVRGGVRIDPSYSTLISQVIARAPGLKYFYMDWHMREDPEHPFLEPILEIFKHSEAQAAQLKILRITPLDPKQLRVLAEQSALRLDSFSGKITLKASAPKSEREEAANALHDFLVSQSASLRTLKFEFDHPEPTLPGACRCCWLNGAPVRLPRMERLEELAINRGLEVAGSTTLGYELKLEEGCETLAEACPALKKLSLRDENDADDLQRLAHPGVTELMVVTKAATFEQLPALLPGVKELNVTLLPPGLDATAAARHLWTSWSALSKLQARIPFNPYQQLDMDALLTGIPGVDVSAGAGAADSLAALVRKYKTRPGIADLTHLESIVLDAVGTRNVAEMTEIGYYFGVGLVRPQLKSAIIQGERVI